jgi:hypothetical protein
MDYDNATKIFSTAAVIALGMWTFSAVIGPLMSRLGVTSAVQGTISGSGQ